LEKHSFWWRIRYIEKGGTPWRPGSNGKEGSKRKKIKNPAETKEIAY